LLEELSGQGYNRSTVVSNPASNRRALGSHPVPTRWAVGTPKKFKELMEDAGLIDQIPAVVWTKDWVVNSKAVGDGRKALRYLAPYVYRVAISNRRIVSVNQVPTAWAGSPSPIVPAAARFIG
jgi:hypothetical protein